MSARRSVNGALAGAVGASVWALQQPLDKLVFRCRYDDVELLGRAVSTDDRIWPAAGAFLHVQNGMAFGAVYAGIRPRVPLPPVAAGVLAGLVEHVALWPLVAVTDRLHPAASELPKLGGSRRAWFQAAWRHALFGAVLGFVEERLNAGEDAAEAIIPAHTNGHGNIERAAVAAG